jgi:hypothetical protein
VRVVVAAAHVVQAYSAAALVKCSALSCLHIAVDALPALTL